MPGREITGRIVPTKVDREAAYAANEGGWGHQLKLLEKFVVTPY